AKEANRGASVELSFNQLFAFIRSATSAHSTGTQIGIRRMEGGGAIYLAAMRGPENSCPWSVRARPPAGCDALVFGASEALLVDDGARLDVGSSARDNLLCTRDACELARAADATADTLLGRSTLHRLGLGLEPLRVPRDSLGARNADASCVVDRAPLPHRPENSGKASRKGDDRNALSSACGNGVPPAGKRVVAARALANNGPC